MANVASANGAQFYLFHAYRSDLDAAFREIKCVKTQSTGHYFEFDGSDWLRHLKKSNLNTRLITFEVRSEHALHAASNDWHLNHDGNRQAMSMLSDILIRKKIVPAMAKLQYSYRMQADKAR
jgi:hypothetical protein